jgi:hypothetical protein
MGLFIFSACSNDEEVQDPGQDSESTQNEQNSEKQKNPILEPDAEQVLNEYKSTFMGLAENANDNGEITELESKEEKLFIKAMDAPTWLVNNKPFNVEKINETEYKVIQERNNELLGHVNMIFVLSHNGESWIVKDIQQEELEDNKNSDINSNITEQEAGKLVKEHLNLENNESVHIKYNYTEDEKHLIHVFDVVGEGEASHTATRGWYYVDIKTGEISNMMES